jgi:hypothetical protein
MIDGPINTFPAISLPDPSEVASAAIEARMVLGPSCSDADMWAGISAYTALFAFQRDVDPSCPVPSVETAIAWAIEKRNRKPN